MNTLNLKVLSKNSLLNKTTFWFLTTVVTAFALKFVHSLSETHELLIILTPANDVLEWMLQTSSKLSASGYYFPKYDIALNKTFTGGNLLVAAFCVFSFTTPYHRLTTTHAILTFIGMIVMAYIFTITVTTVRIVGIIMLFKLDAWIPWLTATWFLQSAKITLYLSMIIAAYYLLKSTFIARFKRFSYNDHYPTF